MDFETAVTFARDFERRYENLVVAGIRRTARERIDSWSLDVINPQTGRLVSIDEKDDVERMLQSALSVDETAGVRRPR